MIGGKLLCLPTSWQIVQRFRRIQIYPWQCINSYTLNMPASSPIFTSLIEWPVQEGPDLLCAFILLLLLPGSWLSLLRFMKFQFWALYFSTTPEVVSFPIRLLFRLCIEYSTFHWGNDFLIVPMWYSHRSDFTSALVGKLHLSVLTSDGE